MEQATTRAYRGGVILAEDFPVADVSDYLEQPDVTVWVDFCAPDRESLHELAGELGLHELAVEDAVGPHQRPKIDYYDTHLFLVCHGVRITPDGIGLAATEIDAFVSNRWLITVRKNDGFSMAPVMSRWERSSAQLAHGTAFLLYGLLDVVVDGYFETVGFFDDYYEDVSDDLFSGLAIAATEQRRWFEARRDLVRFRRLVVPMREVVGGLMRREDTIIPVAMYAYFQDVYDHVLRITEAADTLRELVATIVETNLTLREYRQNQIVKRVTSWAAIVAVPTLVTGYYGMNLPFPGSGSTSGVIASSVLIVFLSIGLYALFRHRDWL